MFDHDFDDGRRYDIRKFETLEVVHKGLTLRAAAEALLTGGVLKYEIRPYGLEMFIEDIYKRKLKSTGLVSYNDDVEEAENEICVEFLSGTMEGGGRWATPSELNISSEDLEDEASPPDLSDREPTGTYDVLDYDGETRESGLSPRSAVGEVLDCQRFEILPAHHILLVEDPRSGIMYEESRLKSDLQDFEDAVKDIFEKLVCDICEWGDLEVVE